MGGRERISGGAEGRIQFEGGAAPETKKPHLNKRNSPKGKADSLPNDFQGSLRGESNRRDPRRGRT